MKKILLFISMILVMSGCTLFGNNTLTCTTNVTSNYLTSSTTYEINHDNNDNVKKVKITYEYNKINDNTDGVGTGTDGTTADDDTIKDGVIDGIVGDAADEIIDSIVDLSGVRNVYNNRMALYQGVEGFKGTVDVDNDNSYKVIYEIDMDKINTTDIGLFNVYSDITTSRNNYENQGLTCK